MQRILLTFFLLLMNLWSLGQVYKGIVINQQTSEPVPFAAIRYEKQHGVMTDIDGNFIIASHHQIDSVHISSIGYHPRRVALVKPFTLIKLKPKIIALEEVIIVPGVNPALRLVKNVIEHRNENNPYKLERFSYRAYDKIFFTINLDTLNKIKTQKPGDTTVAEIEKFFDKQHLFLSENVSEVTFNAPDKRLEKVIASRISGLKNPLFVMMLSSLQSETFYDSRISIGDKNYMNPFQKNALPKYWFHLEDTLLSPNTTDTSFVVSFRPRAGKNFDGLAGQVTISTSGWAFQNVIARPQTTDKGLNIHIEQKYKQIGDSIWFPHQLSTEIFMENIQAENIPIVGRGKRYIDQIRLSADSVADIKSGIEIEIPDDLRKKTQTSLPAFRRIPATAKDSATYHVIDSISKVHHLEKKINGFMALMKGQFRMGKFDIPLGRLLDYNLYEKWRVGLGIKTNDRIHFPISLGGYVAYSSGDHKWKSGVASTFYPDRLKRHSLTYSYINDIESPAQTVFDKPMMEGKLSESSYRNFFFEDFFSVHQHEVMLQNQISTFLNIKTGIRKTSSRALFNYRFDGTSKFLSTVLWTEWRLAPGEKFIKTANKLITKGSRFPVLKLRYDKGIEQWDGAISYHSVAAVLSDDFYTNFIGKTSYQLHAGWVSKTVPLPFLFSAKGSHGNSLNLNCPWSFATMNIHEFMNDQYVALFLRHNFGQLLFSSKWLSPDIVLRHSMMAGKLSHPEEHELLYLGDTHKGYFESGVVFENILKGPFSGIGMGLFYRYGPYRLKKTSENLFINLSIKFLQAD